MVDTIYYTQVSSPLGDIYITGTSQHICSIYFVPPTEGIDFVEDFEIFRVCKQQLENYFTNTSQQFTVATFAQGTEFQERVWQELTSIPWGETRSYADIAAAIGKPSAVRAVATAIGKNPLSILIPCHRVIGSDGALRGYAGGLERKQWLLEHEGVLSR